jgi:hypothetical protein
MYITDMHGIIVNYQFLVVDTRYPGMVILMVY